MNGERINGKYSKGNERKVKTNPKKIVINERIIENDQIKKDKIEIKNVGEIHHSHYS